jgi:hypothetical protein
MFSLFRNKKLAENQRYYPLSFNDRQPSIRSFRNEETCVETWTWYLGSARKMSGIVTEKRVACSIHQQTGVANY